MRRTGTWTGRRGMTFIELMVVLVLVAAISVTILKASQSMEIFPARSEVMNFSGAIKSAYNRSALTGLRYAIVLDIDSGKYSLECTDKRRVVERNLDETAAQRAFKKEHDKDIFAKTSTDKDAKGAKKNKGEQTEENDDKLPSCDDQVVQSHTFERGVSIDRVRTSRMEDPVDEGTVRIAVFPDGTIEPAVIWLKRKKQVWTLFVHQMTGRVEVVHGDEDRVDKLFAVEED